MGEIMTYKELLSIIAIVLTFISFFPYIRSIMLGQVKPHVFSWVIWGVTTLAVFAAQLQGQGGAGAWPIGVSGLITMYVAFIAYLKKSDSIITRTDWIFLVLAMLSLPLWYITADPLSAVILLTFVEVLGFGPTLRKAYHFPFEKSLFFFLLIIIRYLVSIVALEHYSLTTVLFPAVASISCLLLVIVVIYRRRAVKPEFRKQHHQSNPFKNN